MNKETLAFELAKVYIDKCTCIAEERVVEIYQNFLKKLEEKEQEDINKEELELEIGDLKYKIQLIERILEKDKNNFVLKEDLYEILGGNND